MYKASHKFWKEVCLSASKSKNIMFLGFRNILIWNYFETALVFVSLGYEPDKFSVYIVQVSVRVRVRDKD